MTGPAPLRSWKLSPGRAILLPVAIAVALAVFGFASVRQHAVMFGSFTGAASVLVLWAAGLYLGARKAGRGLTLIVSLKPQHWVQTIAQLVIYYWWGSHVPIVAAFAPFIVAQIIFAYGVDALLNWSRRDEYYLGFGPFPIILSINLFLWFRPEVFYWQFVMILVGFLAKELIRWKKNGRSAHIFNPSSFPLAVFSLFLIATHGSDATFGQVIANSIFDPPYIYLVIFLAAVPGQYLFGVARVSLAAVATLMVISLTYLHFTGTYLFLDAHIPVPVFIGLLLLVTDPSTSPQTELGRILFGVLYGVFTTVLYVVLVTSGTPTFYDKLLPIPVLNLMVRALDRFAAWKPLWRLDPTRLAPSLSSRGRHYAYATVMAVVFAGLYATGSVGDHHPGQYLPFWKQACEEGSGRACRYAAHLTEIYCQNGSGWACNEAGVQRVALRQPAAEQFFKRGCDLGYPAACENAESGTRVTSDLARGQPRMEDLPIVLRGTKPILSERDPETLLAVGCREGWDGMCRS
ncbi:MAG: hypothetical protein PVJ02_09870 [Gemmatimonadota bacterium]|jgi:hypothetical protein